MTMNLRMTVATLGFFLASCTSEHRVLVIQQQTELLREPYPLNYPSTAPMPNAIIQMLQPQSVVILSDRYEKDYHVYRIRDSLGHEGYIIGQLGVTAERK